MESSTTIDRAIAVAHAIPGRTRLRIHDVPLPPAVAERVADAVAAMKGVTRVEINRRTGAILCVHTPALADGEILPVARAALVAASEAAAAGPRAPAPSAIGTSVAAELHRLFADADRDLRGISEGKIDLGTATTLTFLAAGALEVLVTQKLPLPPWFNLAWWGFRTFMTTLQRSPLPGMETPGAGGAAPAPVASP